MSRAGNRFVYTGEHVLTTRKGGRGGARLLALSRHKHSLLSLLDPPVHGAERGGCHDFCFVFLRVWAGGESVGE